MVKHPPDETHALLSGLLAEERKENKVVEERSGGGGGSARITGAIWLQQCSALVTHEEVLIYR